MIAHDRIREYLYRLRFMDLHRGNRLVLWRSIIRLAQDEYDRELEELDSLNSLKADPATEVPVA